MSQHLCMLAKIHSAVPLHCKHTSLCICSYAGEILAKRQPKPSLQDALKNDERLANLPVQQVLKEFVDEGKVYGLEMSLGQELSQGAGGRKPTTLDQFVARKDSYKVSSDVWGSVHCSLVDVHTEHVCLDDTAGIVL